MVHIKCQAVFTLKKIKFSGILRRLFFHCLLLMSPFDAFERLVVILVFPGYLHIFLAHLSIAQGEVFLSSSVRRSSSIVHVQQLVCLCTKGHNLDPIFVKLAENVCLYKIYW